MNWLERSWYKQGYWSYLLLPLSLLFWLVASWRRAAYKLGNRAKSPLPVIVVGNITVGGTGKTPFVVYLVALLKQQGFKPGIVSRGYGAKVCDDHPFPRMVTPDSDVTLAGDEPKLLAMKTGVPVVIAPKRVEAVAELAQNTDCDIVISDDGLQHYAMSRDMEIVLLDRARGVGNGWLLPVGPLREGRSRLDTVDLVIENTGFCQSADASSQVSDSSPTDYCLRATEPYQINDANQLLKDATEVKLISGIGNPQRFYDTALGLGLAVSSVHWFPDHHNFSAEDFQSFRPHDVVIMTEKDAVKCQGLVSPEQSKNWYVLPITAVISDSVEKSIINQLTAIKQRQNYGV